VLPIALHPIGRCLARGQFGRSCFARHQYYRNCRPQKLEPHSRELIGVDGVIRPKQHDLEHQLGLSLSDAPQYYVETMLRGIVGFRFIITRIEGKWKMSQNRELNDQLGVMEGLGKRAEGDDLEIADLIQRNLETKN
jgi:hypothetical protein